jgi:hypothetical protein
MGDNSHLHLLLSELPARSRELLQRLNARARPFTLRDGDLPMGGMGAWSREFEELWKAGLLDRVGWGQAPRFRIKSEVRAALALGA